MDMVIVNLGGKPRKLRIDINAMADAEEKLGMGFGQIMKKELSVSMVRTMLWAGLKWQDRRLTVENIGDMVQGFIRDGGDLEELGSKISEAIVASGLVKPEDLEDAEEVGESGDSEPKNIETEAAKT